MSDRVRGGRGTLIIDNAITGEHQEFNTLTCVHCNIIVVLNKERKRDRNWCHRCNAYVCDNLVCITECNPIQEGIELALSNPGKGPFIARAGDGSILFNKELRDRKRLF